MMKYHEALKIWNGRKGGSWCFPKKGSKEYDEVIRIKNGIEEDKKKGSKKIKKEFTSEVGGRKKVKRSMVIKF